MDIGLILAIVFAVLFVGMGFAFLAVKAKQDRAQVDVGMYRDLYAENLAELDRTREDKIKMELALGKSEREHRELDNMWRRQIDTIRELDSQIPALTELWRHSAARAFDLDKDNYFIRDSLDVLAEECTAYRTLYERTANERDALNRDLAGTRETLLSVGNVSEERQQRIQAYEQQQRVSDGNVQRLEAERDEAVGDIATYEAMARGYYADAMTQRRHNDTLNTVQARLMRERDGAAARAMANAWTANALRRGTDQLQADLKTQRRHNDTLNTVQARLMRERDEAVADWVQEFGLRDGWEQTAGELMRERDEAVADWVQEFGLRDGWEQTAGELEWETKRLQTALEVQQNAVTRLDAQLVRARANDTGRDPKTGRFSKK